MNIDFNDCFKEHVPDYKKISDALEILSWAKPNSNDYRIDYIRYFGTLFVKGDLGEAVYCSGINSLKGWTDCDVAYFAGKCKASEFGPGYLEWDSKVLIDQIKESLKETDKTWDDFYKKVRKDALYSEDRWLVWLLCNGENFWGPDQSNWPTEGKRVSLKCTCQLYGLKLALKKVDESNLFPGKIVKFVKT